VALLKIHQRFNQVVRRLTLAGAPRKGPTNGPTQTHPLKVELVPTKRSPKTTTRLSTKLILKPTKILNSVPTLRRKLPH
jgi:hypothetical protein